MSLLAAMFIRFAGFGYVIPRVQSDGRRQLAIRPNDLSSSSI
jgi:hypothetical protein